MRRGAAHEHLNGTLFDETEMEQEDALEETDFILYDDDDDDGVEDPESTGTVVAEAVVPFSTVASHVERAERFLYLRCANSKHPPKPVAPIVLTPMLDRMCAGIVPLLCACQASLQPPRSWPK